MSIEAFIWNYRNGEPIGFDFATVRHLLSTDDTDWIDEHGCLRVRFQDPNDCVDIQLAICPDQPRRQNVVSPTRLRRIFDDGLGAS
jgi:hypothetical protein